MKVLDQTHGNGWSLFNGDSAEVLPMLPARSVDLTISSIPFMNTYCYSPSPRDLGNVSGHVQFWDHMKWVTDGLLRVHKPGSIICIHVANLPEYENTHGASGRYDFRGDTIRHFRSAGLVFHSEVTIGKNPQAQAIRNHSKGLLFVQLERDSRAMWQAWADYLLVFRVPGKHPVQVPRQISQEEWIKLAEPVWLDIRETDVLPVLAAKGEADERHLCALQLGFIRNCLKLWSGPGEVVLDLFNGVGSTGHEAVKMGRKYIGIELKPSYYRVSVGNLQTAEQAAKQDDLFTASGMDAAALGIAATNERRGGRQRRLELEYQQQAERRRELVAASA